MSGIEKNELDEIFGIIPEFELFEDEDLKRRTALCFGAAMREGGWKAADLSEMPFTLLINPCPASFLTHTRAVTQSSLAIADTLREMYPDAPAMHADMDALLSGAILHDVGKMLEYARTPGGEWVKSEQGKAMRHPVTGAALAREHGLPLIVQHMIIAHSWEGDKDRRGVEAIIVHHADFVNFEPLH